MGFRIGEGFRPVNLSCKPPIMLWNGDIFIGLAALLAGFGLMGWMYWLEKRPRKDLRPLLVPTTLILLLGLMLALGAGFHLIRAF